MRNKKLSNYVFDTSFISPYFSDFPKDKAEAQKIEQLLTGFKNENANLIIPSPCLLEIIVAFDTRSKRESVLHSISKIFQIIGFGQAEVLICKDLFDDLFRQTAEKLLFDGERYNPLRDHIRTDIQIFAIAKSINATCLYANDNHLLRLGSSHDLRVLTIENCISQPELPNLYNDFGNLD